MKFEEHEEIINNLNLNDPLIERLKKYKEELAKHGCTFNRLIFDDLGQDIKITYNGNSLD